MKKTKILIPLALSLLLVGCGGNNPQEDSSETSDSTSSSVEVITSVQLADSTGKTSGSILVGESLDIEAKISGVLASEVSIVSSDPDVARVSCDDQVSDPDGSLTIKVTITALKAGSANIVASAAGKSASFAVTVPEQSLTIDGETTVLIGASIALEAKAANIKVEGSTFVWTSSDETVASVAGDGANATVTGLKAGSATIKVAFGGVESSLSITVPEQGLVIEGPKTVYVGKEIALEAKSSNIVGSDYVWSIDNSELATLTGNGASATLAGIKAGTVKVKVSFGGVEATLDVTVSNVEADGVTIENKSDVGDLPLHRSITLSASVSPDDVTFKDITWSSSDETIATVGDDGTVTGVKQGEATITATCGTKSDSVVIKVTDPVIKADEVTNLPSSYKASLTHTYEVDVINDGKTKDAAFTFKADSKVTSTYSGTAPTVDIPVMILSAEDMGTTTSERRYIKFTVSKAGTYSIFSNNSDSFDAKIWGLYEVDEDGQVSDTAMTDVNGDKSNDDFEKGGDANGYCQYMYDFCFDVELEEGKSYVAEIKGGKQMLFGVINVEDNDGVKSLTSAYGVAPKQTVNDSYSGTYIADTMVYCENDKSGMVGVDDKVYPFSYDSVEEEYAYNTKNGTDLSLDDYFSWDAILSDPNLKWVETDVENHVDDYVVDFTSEDLGKDSPIASFASCLGLLGKINAMYITSDYVSNTVSFMVSFGEDDASKAVTIVIEEASEAPVSVHGYDVSHEGEAGGDSGIDDNWGE